MKVFENIEIEFFDMADARQRPNDQEEVVLVLKDCSRSQKPSYRRRGNSGQRLAFATYKMYTSVPCKFKDTSGTHINTYKLEDVICWGRLKKD